MPVGQKHYGGADLYCYLFGDPRAYGATHLTIFGDSLNTSGRDANHTPKAVGAYAGYDPLILSGFQPHLFLGNTDGTGSAGGNPDGSLSTRCETQEVSSGTSVWAIVEPGQAVFGAGTALDGSTSGIHAETVRAFAFNDARFNDALFRRQKINTAAFTNWFKKNWTKGRKMVWRQPFLASAVGCTALKLQTLRNGSQVAIQTGVSVVGSQEVVFDTDLGKTSTDDSLEMKILSSATSTLNKTLQILPGFVFADEIADGQPYQRGLYIDNVSHGSWGVGNHSDPNGGTALVGSPAYDGKMTDAAIQRRLTVSKITGTNRIFCLAIGQNNPDSLNKAQYKAAVLAWMNRMWANSHAAGISPILWLCAPADPGPSVSTRFQDYADACFELAAAYDSPANRVFATDENAVIGTPGTDTVQSKYPTWMLSAYAPHYTATGAKELSAMVWASLKAEGQSRLQALQGKVRSGGGLGCPGEVV